ncbi:MAG: type I-MYXAN CRISPR-associated protein Cas6/Cmx6 [Planctomycetia bacterium]|nr:type I-MYXAN CRISPR-associated protein Cas6/Cmx6 [Planctomycetia bacterium]
MALLVHLCLARLAEAIGTSLTMGESRMHVDLTFRLQGTEPIPADHGYALYAAVSHLIPELHRENGVAIHPIRGRQIGDRKLMLMPWSALAMRVPDNQIAPLLKLAGKSLRLDYATVRVGVPEVRALVPSTAIQSRLVVIKVAHVGAEDLTAATFTVAARRQMDELRLGAEAILTVGKRRSFRLKQREIVGYELRVSGLTTTESLVLQETGLGGKRHMGCGVFVAAGEERT